MKNKKIKGKPLIHPSILRKWDKEEYEKRKASYRKFRQTHPPKPDEEIRRIVPKENTENVDNKKILGFYKKSPIEIDDSLWNAISPENINFELGVNIKRKGVIELKWGESVLCSSDEIKNIAEKFEFILEEIMYCSDPLSLTPHDQNKTMNTIKRNLNTCHRCLQKSRSLYIWKNVVLCQSCYNIFVDNNLTPESAYIKICDNGHSFIHESYDSPCPICYH